MKVADHVLRYFRDTYELGIKYHRHVLHPDTLWGWFNTDWVGDTDTMEASLCGQEIVYILVILRDFGVTISAYSRIPR
jgi:hypothetical protein